MGFVVKISEIAEELIEVVGMDAAEKYMAAYGGKTVKIPLCVLSFHSPSNARKRLISVLGDEAFKKFIARFGGCRIYVPRHKKISVMRARNQKIIADYTSGKSLPDLVDLYDLCERQIRNILKKPTD